MYKSLTEKDSAFKHVTVNSTEELQNLINTLSNKPSLRFRGVCEAKYTMLTSLQRNCPSEMQGKQKEYLERLLHRIKRDSEVLNYFKNKKIAINDISCLALMQHYGLPTPLLDFTTDINVALSFASHDLKTDNIECETDNYASLYFFDKLYEHEVGTPIQQVYMSGMADGFQLLQDHLREKPTEAIDASILKNIDEFIKWDDLKDIELTFIEYQPIAPGVVTLSGQSLNLSNPNLDNQKGCFLLNLYAETMPLEENWNGRTSESRNKFWLNSGPGFIEFPFSGVMTRDKMWCFDIKKDVIKKWAENNPIQIYDNSCKSNEIKRILQNLKTTLDAEIQNKY